MTQPDTIVRAILAGRGLTEDSDVEDFLSKKPKQIYDPFLLSHMEEGVDILFHAIETDQKITVYGDYDADGLTACSLLCGFLRLAVENMHKNAHIDYYIPSRFEEGYGLNTDALTMLREKGTNLVITVDCGSVSATEIAYGKSLGLEVIVTDHHDCIATQMPDCVVINPKYPGSDYPFPFLAGCAVAFKFAQAFREKFFPENKVLRAELNRMLDLVAVGTVADVVPLLHENRTFVKYGLTVLNSGRRLAFSKLIRAIGQHLGEISSYNIAFGIAPHINASGRLSEAACVVELFLTEDEARMDEIVDELVALNRKRREIQDDLFARCVETIELSEAGDQFLLLNPHDVHEGISGIVAGKLKSRYHLPVAVLADTQDEASRAMLKGSARSIPGVDMIEMLREHEELFSKLGGHPMAAGFTLPAENEERLRNALNADMQIRIEKDPSILIPDETPEWLLAPEDADLALAEALTLFEPTGSENPKPLIAFKAVTISEVRSIGQKGKHLRFTASGIPCVYFNAEGKKPSEGHVYTLLGSLEVNEFRGSRSAQFIVRRVL
ncbi:MAG: single-stranded-DNA-specific exonuclease RecJ [Clostridiales Family XIII bacterium]|jgi:single-stranded-DNA-specific exonuclease|nr:single-stranded-DNA-specific exonuclease RecJ [Clostridiales Family XIII bacterium]